MKNSKTKILLVMLLSIVMVAAMLLPSCSKEEEEAAAPPSNALTGETAEDGYDEAASGRRIAAFVVENAPDARPQWGLDDANYSPDIVIQGEVEGGITRTLWMYADYEKLPEIIGPTRSARPPFIKFSELFDSIFIHWGMSHSKGDYVGASSVFKKDDVDHINQMTLDDKEDLFGRDDTRDVGAEHRGIINGAKVPATIKNEGFRTEPEEFTKLSFNAVEEPAGENAATQLGVTFSDRAFEDTHWEYNEEDGLYHTSDYDNDFVRENVLILYDDTEYIVKEDYEGPGSTGSVTYCDYKLKGGKAQLFSKGTEKDLEWAVEDGKLILKDPAIDAEAALAANEEAKAAAQESAEEGEAPAYNKYTVVSPEPEEGESEEDVLAKSYVMQNLNKGKTWIGWISANNGGSVSFK